MQNDILILDSNIWISYFITKRLDKLVELIQENNLTVLTCGQLIAEIQNVLARPKFIKYIKGSDIKEFVAIHTKLCSFADIEVTINQLTDPGDNFLLNLYTKGGATALVSGDKELLYEAGKLNYRVMTLKEFELVYSMK